MALQHFRWPAPLRGEFPTLAPDRIPKGGARSLRNYLVHLPDKIVPRGSIGGTATTEIGALPGPSGAPLAGTFAFNDRIYTSYREPTASPTVDAWRVPINRPTLSNQLTQATVAANSTQAVELETGATFGSAAVSGGDLDRVFGHRNCRLDEYIYAPSFGGPSTAIPTGVAQLSRINKANNAAGLRLTNGPGFVQDVITHYNRVFAAAARAPGAASGYDPSMLYYTIDGGTTALTDVLTDWQDPVTSLVNTIQVGASLDGDFIVALARARGHLVIFKRKSVWILYGTSLEDFTLRQLRTVAGCVDARSVVTADEGVYFASQRGFELFDGTKFQLLSGPVADTWLEFSNRGPGAATVNHSYIRCEALPNDYIHVAFGTDPHTASATDGAERNWLYYIPTGSFVDLTCAITSLGMNASGAFNRAVVTPAAVTLWGASEWARCDLLTYGPTAAIGVRDRDAAASFSVPLSWTTGLADLGDIWFTATLKRASVDYRQKWWDNTPATLDPFATVAIADSTGTTLATPGDVLGYRAADAPLRRRRVFDTNHNLDRGDIELVIASTNGAAAATRIGELAIYSADLEFEVGRNRRL